MMPSLHCIILAAAAAAACAPACAFAQDAKLDAPNVVVISPRLVTSGQPTASALEGLGAQGFGTVIYLVPPGMHDAIKDEPALVEGQGIKFVNIPMKFDDPTENDFEAFAAALAAAKDRKVLVHCQVNMRGSAMVFLHRVIVGKESPDVAYDAVTKVWVPDGTWKRYIVSMLRKNGVAFEPY